MHLNDIFLKQVQQAMYRAGSVKTCKNKDVPVVYYPAKKSLKDLYIKEAYAFRFASDYQTTYNMLGARNWTYGYSCFNVGCLGKSYWSVRMIWDLINNLDKKFFTFLPPPLRGEGIVVCSEDCVKQLQIEIMLGQMKRDGK